MTEVQTAASLPKSAATLALLKALHDAGKDHVEMFQPFVEHAIAALLNDDFSTADLQPALHRILGLAVPLSTLDTLLSRAVNRGHIKREGGRYFKIPGALQNCDIAPKLLEFASRQEKLCAAFRAFAAEKHIELTDEEAWHHLIAFIQDTHIGLLLEQDVSAFDGKDIFHARDAKLVASFVTDECLKRHELRQPLQAVLEGFILQNTLLLRDIKTVAGPFRNLRVFFDTRFLFDVIGVSGAPALTAARESLELVRSAGARLAAFEITIREMRRVLAFYENHIGTSQGRMMLRPTGLTRYLLTNRSGPSDVRELSALLESKIAAVGISIVEMPARKAKYTLGEEDLAKRLRKPNEDADIARVTHDVDCVAAVLVLRGGKQADDLEQAREIFATTTGLVVKNVNSWYREEGQTGVPPTIFQASLSSRAWLKKPAVAADVKLHELIAVCAAVLRPSVQVWSAAINHLRRMKERGEITSDEQVAVVANEFMYVQLGELPPDIEPDAATISEVIERVQERYREQADGRVTAAEARAAEMISNLERLHRETSEAAATSLRLLEDRLRRAELRIDSFAESVAGLLSWILFAAVGALLIAGTWFGLGGMWGIIAGAIVVAWTLIGFIWGTSLADVRAKTRSRIHGWIRRRFLE